MRVSELIGELQKAPSQAEVVVYYHNKKIGFIKDINHVGSRVMDEIVFIGVDELTPIQRDSLLAQKARMQEEEDEQSTSTN